MLIDDNQVFCDELKETLSLNGCEVFPFFNGEQALKSVGKIKPEIILLDLKMDGLSGFQVADKLKKNEKTKTIPIIAISGFYRAHETFFNIHNIYCCLTKPFNPEVLIDKIKEAIKQSRASVK